MHRRPERCLRLFWSGCRSFQDHSVVPHGSPNKATLTRKRWCGSLADHYELLAALLFLPGEIVVVVDEIQLLTAEYRDDFARDPFSSRVRVLAAEFHHRPVRIAERCG